MTLNVVLQVPQRDREDLDAALMHLSSEGPVVESRPFDGDALVQAMVILSTGTYPFFRTWVMNRAKRAVATQITFDGITLKAVSPDEALRLFKALEGALREHE